MSEPKFESIKPVKSLETSKQEVAPEFVELHRKFEAILENDNWQILWLNDKDVALTDREAGVLIRYFPNKNIKIVTKQELEKQLNERITPLVALGKIVKKHEGSVVFIPRSVLEYASNHNLESALGFLWASAGNADEKRSGLKIIVNTNSYPTGKLFVDRLDTE